MQINKSFYAPDRESWRAWLSKHGATETEVWLIYYKVISRQHRVLVRSKRPMAAGRCFCQPCITYEESVEEALCFGWIDSLIQKIDRERYARKFTPRRPGSAWSDTNKRRVAKVLREGRMTAAGLARIDYPLDEEPPPPTVKKELVLPEWLSGGLQSSPLAWENFTKLPPSHQRRYAGWIADARRDDTRQRRIQEAIRMLEKNERLGMK